jgi:hypothetical protein
MVTWLATGWADELGDGEVGCGDGDLEWVGRGRGDVAVGLGVGDAELVR